MVKRASTGVRGTPSGPVSETVAADVLKERQPTTVRGGEDITQGRVPGIEVPHIDHAVSRSWRESRMIDPS